MIKKYFDFLNENNIEVKTNNNSIRIKWIDETKNPKEVGVCDFLIRNEDAIIIGYNKNNKNINGYKYIKKSIDYVLNLGYNIVSYGNKSEKAIEVWKKLKDEYNVDVEYSKSGDDNKNNINIIKYEKNKI